MSRIYISAAHKSSGKTTISIGLCAELNRLGYQVQSYKKGPDYIDPQWLAMASGKPCYNLDFNTMTHSEIDALWARHEGQADVTLLEGNKGLFDGVDTEGSDSNAALAKQLDLPVVLVVDVEGITRGVAPLIMGYQQFDEKVQIAGLILNKVVGHRHESKLRAALARYTDIPVLGAIYRNTDLVIDERHLGLVPNHEHSMSERQIEIIRKVISDQVDMDQFIKLFDVRQMESAEPKKESPVSKQTGLRIGIAMDSAFGFYYQDDLECFTQQGAEIVPIDLIHDKKLPEIDGLFIGGGFPETHMQALSDNQSMRNDVAIAADNGLPIYAECGGLMYLCRRLNWGDKSCEMVGALPADVKMHKRPQGRGYVKLKQTVDAIWTAAEADALVAAHEFHHSSIGNIGESVKYSYEVKRGHGIDGQHDGMIYHNILASYAHLRNTQSSPWVENFVAFVRAHKAVH